MAGVLPCTHAPQNAMSAYMPNAYAEQRAKGMAFPYAHMLLLEIYNMPMPQLLNKHP